MENQTYIRGLFQKFIDGQCNASEAEALLQYLRNSKDTVFVKELIESQEKNIDLPHFITERQTEEILKDSYGNILGQISAEKKVSRSKLLYAVLSTAASILVIGCVYLLYQYQTRYHLMTVSVPYGQRKQLTLPDDSKLWLNAGTTVRYPKEFEQGHRTVILDEGQAFFDVVHEKNRPFIVKLKDATVNVLGTSFDIESYRNEARSVVTVHSGKVGVIPSGEKKQAVFLLPAQKLVINTSSQIDRQKISSPADIAAWKDNRIAFSEENFGTIIRALERQYNVQIKVKKAELFEEKITLKLEGQSLKAILEALSFSNHFTYKYANEREIIIE